MWRDPNDQIQVARLPSIGTTSALSMQPDPLPIHHSSRDVEVKSARTVRAAYGQGALRSVVGLFDGDLCFDLLIGAGNWAPIGPATATENAAEQVLEVDVLFDIGISNATCGPAWSARSWTSGPCTCVGSCLAPRFGVHVGWHATEVFTKCVVPLTEIRIGEHVVRLRNLLESCLGRGVFVDVRVMGPSQLPVGALDLGLVGVPGNTEDLVEVLCHQSLLVATTTAAGRRISSSVPYP